MATPSSTNRGCAVVYGALYAVALVCAAANGGMAFVLPVILGFPWTLILGLLILIPQIPTPFTVVIVMVVPPAINVFLMLRTRGIVHAPRESLVRTRRPLEDR